MKIIFRSGYHYKFIMIYRRSQEDFTTQLPIIFPTIMVIVVVITVKRYHFVPKLFKQD